MSQCKTIIVPDLLVRSSAWELLLNMLRTPTLDNSLKFIFMFYFFSTTVLCDQKKQKTASDDAELYVHNFTSR